MKKWKCDYCKATCYISWFKYFFKFERPSIYKWRNTIFWNWLCPNHSNRVNRAFVKYLKYSDYDPY